MNDKSVDEEVPLRIKPMIEIEDTGFSDKL
jgi:hypothetical protein